MIHPLLDEEAGADPEGLLSELDSPHVEVLVPGNAAARPCPQVPRAPAGLVALDELDQLALHGAAGGVLEVDLVLPLELRVERVGEDVPFGVDHEHLRVAVDEGPLRIADERQRGPPVTRDALGGHVDELDHEAAIRHEVVHAAAHDVALVRRALHAAQERRLPGRRAATGTLALVEDPGAITLAGEGLDAPAAEGATLGAPDRAQVPADARRVVAGEEDPGRVGLRPPRRACQGRAQEHQRPSTIRSMRSLRTVGTSRSVSTSRRASEPTRQRRRGCPELMARPITAATLAGSPMSGRVTRIP